MTAVQRPRLGRWGDRGLPCRDDHVVIFVHGILSDSSTFDKLLPNLAALDPNHNLDFWVFDYDYRLGLVESGDQLAQAIIGKSIGDRRVDVVGHSMGGLVARMAVLRHDLKKVARIITLATPNHGAINGAQLNLLGQMITLGFRTMHPIYARAAGILDLTNVPAIMRDQLTTMHASDPARLSGKSYVSIPAQYFHLKRQVGDEMPSLLMGGLTVFRELINTFTRNSINLKPVHDGIVEERSNQLHPAPTGSSGEGAYMATRNDPNERILHATHEAAADCDHVTVTACPEIADLIQAVLRANRLEAVDIDPFLSGPPNRVTLRPTVI